MKKILLTLMAASLLCTWSPAQIKSNVILFTDNGEKFTAILNGLRMNEEPATHVKITDLTGEFYKLKVIFADRSLGEKTFNLNLSMNQGHETTFNITKNKKGEYVLRYMGSVPLATAPPAPAGTYTIVYSENLPPENAPVRQTVTHQVTTTTQSTTTEQVNVNMGVQVGETGGNININISASDPNVVTQQTTTVKHTVTTTTTTTGAPAPPPPPVYLPGYTGPVGCPYPLSPAEFADLKRSIATKSFEDSKLTIAKQVISNACLLSSQVKELMLLFTFEESRLELAKFAYGRTYDIGNYYQVNDAFTFETSIEELNEYISRMR